MGYMPLAAAPRSTKRSRFTLPPSDERCLRRALTGKNLTAGDGGARRRFSMEGRPHTLQHDNAVGGSRLPSTRSRLPPLPDRVGFL